MFNARNVVINNFYTESNTIIELQQLYFAELKNFLINRNTTVLIICVMLLQKSDFAFALKICNLYRFIRFFEMFGD